MVITGPNAGGKTVALKTVGLLALMAHAGLHVPAEAAQFSLLDGIYADIGDQQSIEQSLSTFSSHIQNLRGILDQVTPSSLVLIDELGTSTDPEEGAALAQAILGHFRDRGVLTIATTHHRGVARYVQEHAGMLNASVDLEPASLEPHLPHYPGTARPQLRPDHRRPHGLGPGNPGRGSFPYCPRTAGHRRPGAGIAGRTSGGGPTAPGIGRIAGSSSRPAGRNRGPAGHRRGIPPGTGGSCPPGTCSDASAVCWPN